MLGWQRSPRTTIPPNGLAWSCRACSSSVQCSALSYGKSSVDQAHVRESLRKVAEHCAWGGIDFLTEQTKIIAVSEHIAKLCFGFVERSTSKSKVLCCPEAADAKRAFSGT